MKHTSGPWRITANQNGPLAIVHDEDTVSCVCKFDEQHPNPIHPNKKANAYLIAAAPEMLEALETLVNIYYKGCETPEDHQYIIDLAEKLIEKAKGKL